MSELSTEDPTIIDEQKYRSDRLSQLKGSKGPFAPINDINIFYPHKFNIDTTFDTYVETYRDIENGTRYKHLIHSLAGRVREKRCSGKQLIFYNVESDNHSLQFLLDKKEYDDKDNFELINSIIHRGDIIGVTGFVGKSLRGELSIYPTKMTLLTPCLKYIPKVIHGLKDPEIRAKKRYLDLIANPQNRNVIVISGIVCKEIRKYLNKLNFIEVYTRVLSPEVGGANAKPFITFHNDLKQNMYLRIAPELYLKKLVIGGLNRVYEIGQQFRNESIDKTHNPEFLSLEFYMAYADYYDLMKMCEEMFKRIVLSTCGKLVIDYTNSQGEDITIDFSPPYPRIDVVTELAKNGIDLTGDLFGQETQEYLNNICTNKGIECSEPRTTARLLDKLIGEYIEPKCINPTFVINHPLIMSPLAKQHREYPHLSERFELFVCGMELANAYTELNNPDIQRKMFMEQQKARSMGDEEAQLVDEEFLDALEYGLPPTGGFGCGIQRLIMFLTNRNTIRDVIAFPAVSTTVTNTNKQQLRQQLEHQIQELQKQLEYIKN